MKFIPHDYTDSTYKWEEVIHSAFYARPIYLTEPNQLQYSRVAKVILGVYDDAYDMQNYLYELTTGPIEWEILFGNMPKFIDDKKRTEIINILQLHKDNPISLNRFMAFFAGKQLLPLMQTQYRDHFIDTLRQWLEFIEKRYPKLMGHQMQRIFLDFVKWSNHYFPKWVSEHPFEQQMPKIIWYGPAKESEVYFLYFLYLFGCDMVIFSPNRENIFEPYNITLPTEVLAKESELFDFPFEKPIRVQTVTARASDIVQQHLYDNSALNYPWKYADYETRSRILNTTYDELFILSEAQIYLREGFGEENNTVYIPVLFAKVEGISADIKDYAKKLYQLQQREMVHIVNKFPLLPLHKSNMKFHMRDASTQGKLDVEKMMQLSIWPFKNMSLGAQRNIARTMIRLIDSDYVYPSPGSSREEHAQYLFGQLLLIPQEYVRLYQQFDYSFTNPMVMIFKEENSGQLQRQDAVLLKFLSMLGFDVLIFNPSASLGIEHHIQSQLINTFRLEKISFDETFDSILDQYAPKGLTGKSRNFRNLLKRFTRNDR